MARNFLGYCPLCTNAINPDKQIGELSICDCGWTSRIHHIESEERQASRTAYFLLLVAGTMAAAMVHFSTWGNRGWEILPIKAAQLTGQASYQQLERLSTICLDQFKWDCVEEAYFQMHRLNTQDREILGRLGMLQARRDKFAEATLTLGEYFRRQGRDVDAAFQYARSLSKTNHVAEANRYFEFVLRSKPNVVQHSVIKTYVDHLITNNQFGRARDVIESYRKKGDQFAYFLENEWQNIRKKLESRKSS